MKTYYIYHISGVKIGCTSDLIKRMSDQGFTDWEILEEHTNIYEVSDREIQLQKEYGLPVDKVPYWKSVENRPVWNDAARSKGHATLKSNGYKHTTKASHASIPGKLKLTIEQAEEIKALYVTGKYTQRQLGKMFNVSQHPIKEIVNNRDTKHRIQKKGI